jgi:hypothetical protein
MKTALETTMQGYDTIVAVTQNNINANLKFLYGERGGIQPSIKLYDENQEEGLEATIAPPTVRLNVNGETSKAIFKLNLKKGVLKYWKGRGPKAVLQEQAINNWVIGFKVDLNLTDSIEWEHVPQNIKDKIIPRTSTGEVSSEIFSVRQLFMDFQNAFLTELDKLDTFFPTEVADPTEPHKLKDKDLDYTFFKFLENYIDSCRTNKVDILGYSVTTKNPNKVDIHPSFPPTAVTFATNLFLPDGTPKPDLSSYTAESDSSIGGLDTLNFLMMTEHRSWPSSNPSAPIWFGNWVTSKDEYGVVAVAKQLFVDNFLLPKLAETTTLESSYQLSNPKGTITEVSYDSKLVTTRGKGFYTADSNELGSYNYNSGSKSTSIGIPGPGWKEEHTWTVTHTAKVQIPPGSNKIYVNGASVIRADCIHWHGIPHHSLKDTWWRSGSTSWALTLTLSSVTTGALAVNVAPTEQELETSIRNNTKCEEGGDWIEALAEALAHLFRQKLDNFTDCIVSDLKSIYDDLARLVEEVEKSLNGTSIFVFPGSQEFKMKDPCFNNELDLLVKTEYEFY